MREPSELLAKYLESDSESAFRELVECYIDMVYSVASRFLNGDSHLAQDVTQTVFVDLARLARSLPANVMLGGWLHRHTCFVASKALRSERRRQEREREAASMQSQDDHGPANLAEITPVLDEAIDSLNEEDRQAVLLRYFERKDFRSLGVALGCNEDAARKRVDRALSKLHSRISAKGASLSLTALAASLATQVVQAAPAGFSATVASTALSCVAVSQGTSTIAGILLGMSKTKAVIVGAFVIAAVSVPLVLQQKKIHDLENQAALMKQTQAEELARLGAETSRLSNLLATASARAQAPASPEDLSREVLKLRGEVGRLRQENASVSASAKQAPSALSGLTDNPEAKKVLRAQQRMGLAAIFGRFSKNASLTKEQTEQFHDALADSVMSNIDHVMKVLKNGSSKQEMEALIGGEEVALKEKLKAQLGPEAFSKYEDYYNNLASTLTAEQFKGMLGGDKDRKDEVGRQLYDLVKQETKQALVAAGLSPDYQVVPSLNFRNFASEEEGDRSLALLKSVYEKVAAKAGSFLNSEELGKFAEFTTAAVENNKAALLLNRRMMAPPTPPSGQK